MTSLVTTRRPCESQAKLGVLKANLYLFQIVRNILATQAVLVVALSIASVFTCQPAQAQPFGGPGPFGGGGFRGGFPATGRTGSGGFGPGYFASTGYTPGMVANNYRAMGYNPFLSAYNNFGGYGSSYYGSGGYGGYGYPYSYGGYYPYSSTYTYDFNPGEYLQGAASVYNAQGIFLVKQAEAQKLRQEVQAAQLENRRKAYDQALYEREHTPTAAEIRAKELEDSFRRSMADPPLSLIVSGQALNDLLVGLAHKLDPSKPVPGVPLDPSVLLRISVTSGAQRTSAVMLQNGGKVEWPHLLRGPEQKDLDTLLPQAVDQVLEKGIVDPKLLDQIAEALDRMTERLDAQANGEITPNQHIQANRFLNNLRSSVRALRQPNAMDYFNGKISAKGESVPQLVQYMVAHNLRFATALPGQDEAYIDLHHALVAQAMHAESAVAASSGSGFRLRLGPNLPTASEDHTATPRAGAE